MKKYFILLTEDGEIFSDKEFATEQQAADWVAELETDERIFIEPIIEVV